MCQACNYPTIMRKKFTHLDRPSPQSLYLHIPFCRSKCLYCDFYSVPFVKSLAASCIATLCRQISTLEGNFETIYIGGGTPSVLDTPLLKQLFTSLKPLIAGAREITIEINPESVEPGKLALFSDSGINRVSIGVQSLQNKYLRLLGRAHNCRQALNAVRATAACGITNISIDLIFGMPGQSIRDLKTDLEQAIALPVTHISAYALTCEKHTPLQKLFAQAKLSPLDEETGAAMYNYIMDYLPKNGFSHYEISNFAKPGLESKHNINYWENNDYLGLGPGATSYIRGERTQNTPDVRDYITKINRGSCAIDSKERLSAVARAKETAAVKVRTREGIDFDWFTRKTGFDIRSLEASSLPALKKEKLITITKKRIFLTRKGFLFCDTVSSELL